MAIIDDNGNRTYTTTDRKLIVKEQFVDRFFKGIDTMFEIAKTSDNPYNDPRMDFTVNLMTLFVLDGKKSKELREERKQRVKNETSGIIDEYEKNIIKGEINLDTLGYSFEGCDDFMGFQKKQVILEIKDGESVKYANELNNTYIEKMMACQGDLIGMCEIVDGDKSDSTEESVQVEETEDSQSE